MHIASLHLYPLKSAAVCNVDALEIGPRGPRHDRNWMIVDVIGRFVTGRQQAEIVLIRAVPQDNGLALSAPGMDTILVATPADDAPRRQVSVWGDNVDAASAGATADAWISAYLQQSLHIVYMDARSTRAVDSNFAQVQDQVAFADGYPLLAISQSALDALNTRVLAAAPNRAPLSMTRFRPNLVIANSSAHAEDQWRRVRIGDVLFDAVKLCTRCVFTTVDPATSIRDTDGEPLNTLKTYRRTPAGITFGMNLIPRSLGSVRMGDGVEVLD